MNFGWQGIVVSLHIAAKAAAAMMERDKVLAVAGKGLAGDRYFEGKGTYSNRPGSGRALTLIESEAIEALRRDYQVTLAAGSSRRNIVSRGVALNHLVGKEFRVGNVILRGMRLCDPCAHLEKLTVAGAMRGLIHRGGLRAEIIAGGLIKLGDPITIVDG